MICDICKRDPGDHWFILTGPATGFGIIFCSPSCIMEWAWKEREATPKLSKSRVESRCDHKFVDSKNCIRCGWSPEE